MGHDLRVIAGNGFGKFSTIPPPGWQNASVLTTFAGPMNDLFDQSRAEDRARPDARVIAIRGAREHNLKDIDVEIPRDRLVVITGLSGSGKSSLAFDTIYSEGQPRYVE